MKRPAKRMSPHMKQRKSEAVLLIARAIPGFETRIMPHFLLEEEQINWKAIEPQDWNHEERLAIQWMKFLWTSMPPRGGPFLSELWWADEKIKEAIVCALARVTYTSHVISEYYREKQTA
jgi:hypothetical protein